MKVTKTMVSLMLATLMLSMSAGVAAESTVAGSPASDARDYDAAAGVAYSPADEHGRYRYLITFAEPGMLAEQRQRAPGQRFDANAPAAMAHRNQLMAQQAVHVQNIAGTVGRQVDVSHYYLVTHSGLATLLTPDEAQQVERLAGVVSVERERVYELTTYRGPTFMGADAIWDGSAVPGGLAMRGEDMVIAVIDTGIDPNHPSFANDPSCGHGGGSPDKLISFLDCHSTDGGGVCNGPSPADGNSHGSHVASTAGGNTLDNTATPSPQTPGPFTEMAGVAPCAHIRSYRACGPGSGCNGAALTAGLNNILLPGDIDVLNYSISGGNSPWTDGDRLKLNLVEAGIFVAASAGNTSTGQPNPVGQVNHRGPWVLTVAASTRDTDAAGGSAQGDVLAGFSFRGPTPAPLQDLQKPDITAPGVSIYAATVGFEVSVSGPGTPPAALQDIAMNIGSQSPVGSPLTDHPIRFDPDQPVGQDGCNPGFPANFFDGSVALIQRGICSFTEKINNAATAGADMVIIWNNAAGGFGMDTTGQNAGTPAFSITQADGQALINFIDANPGATIDYDAQLGSQYGFLSGTSMSSPHAAGAAALIRQAQPSWTVSEVKSAMQMTASRAGTKENGVTPWDWDDIGSGRADLTAAALAGLVMDETIANYLAANTSGGSINVKDLNLAAVRDMDCSPSCTWTRTVRNTLDDPSNWTAAGSNITPGFDIDVSPSSFSFTGDIGETQELTITATPTTNLTGAVAFGEVVLTETGDLSPGLHITVAIRGVGALDPEIEVSPASLATALPEGNTNMQALTITNNGEGDLHWNLFETNGEIWSENFDGYALGEIHGQGGWAGWQNDPGLGAPVSDAESNSPPHALQISGNNDPVRPFTGVDSGQVTVTAWQFIPAGFSGTSYFILLNTYNHAGTGLNWSTQVNFDSASSSVVNDGASGGSLPLITGQWVEIRVEIDLDADTQSFYYDDQLLYAGTWTDEVSGGGASNFGAVNLFANGASAVHYDDLSLAAGSIPGCDGVDDLPWLSATPVSGTTPPLDSSGVGVTFDSTGLADDVYQASLCITSNDPATPVVTVPVTLTVGEIIDALFHDRFEDVAP